MELKQKIESIIEKIRPALEADGGGIELVDILEEEKVVLVNLTGACHGCPMSLMTLKGYVEKTITEEVPEIQEVRLAY